MIHFSKLIRHLPQHLLKWRFYPTRALPNHIDQVSVPANRFIISYSCQSKFQLRLFSISVVRKQENQDEDKQIEEKPDPRILKDPTKDRRVKIPVETSICYLKSAAYKECYGDDPVWKLYRRNYKGAYPPKKTRKMCIRRDIIATGNPCPICRDEYLVVDYRNVDLLKQFISPINGELFSYQKTGVCRQQQDNLIVAYLKAKDYGLIIFHVPFRKYDYSEYQVD